jgi:hypothetical protein
MSQYSSKGILGNWIIPVKIATSKLTKKACCCMNFFQIAGGRWNIPLDLGRGKLEDAGNQEGARGRERAPRAAGRTTGASSTRGRDELLLLAAPDMEQGSGGGAPSGGGELPPVKLLQAAADMEQGMEREGEAGAGRRRTGAGGWAAGRRGQTLAAS